MADFKIMRNGLNTEIVGDPHIGQSSEDVTVAVTDDGTYTGYEKKLYYSYGYRNQIYRAIADENSSNEFVIPMTAFLEPGMVRLSLELSKGTNKPTCNAVFIIVTEGAKSVAASDILPDDATWEQYVASYVKSHADTLKGDKGDKGDKGEKGEQGTPTDDQVQASVDKWLMEHPEATTTVEDGSITEEKFSSDTKLWNTQRLSIISNEYKNSGYAGELFNQFGANINVFADYIDTDSHKELFYRVYRNNVVGDGKVGIMLACYDSGKNYLYTMKDLSGDYTSKFTTLRLIVVNETLNEANVRVKAICRADIPDEVKFVRFAIQGNSDFVKAFYERLVISYEDFTDYDAVEKTVYNEKLITAVESITGSSGKPEIKSKTMVMIGDSLTNWGGGNDTEDGFLKIVHDSTGVVTSNEGLAGAWWQIGDGQTQCGVKRVDKIIADKRKYDVYCFMLGTNAGSITDTGETSANTSTMCGAIRYCMEKLKAYDPTGIILVLLPPQRAEGNDAQEKVNAVIKSIVNSYSVKTLDIYHEGGIVPNTKIANVNYLSDGLHLSKNGYTVLGNILSSEIKYLLCI